jgi:hypothetical protein
VFRFLAVLLFALTLSVPAHARVFVSLGFPFFPYYYGPAYSYPPAYYPPPYYYPPQQGYYPPQQGYYPPQQGYAPDSYAPQSAPPSYPAQTVSPAAARNCRDYRGDATIDSSGRPFHGRACLESDGKWHVVQ